jgi:hypothetical protein
MKTAHAASRQAASEWKVRMGQTGAGDALAQQQDVSWNIAHEYSVRYGT